MAQSCRQRERELTNVGPSLDHQSAGSLVIAKRIEAEREMGGGKKLCRGKGRDGWMDDGVRGRMGWGMKLCREKGWMDGCWDRGRIVWKEK